MPKKLVIGGLGPAKAGQMTLETRQKIAEFQKRGLPIILRTGIHPAAEELIKEGIPLVFCDCFYEQGEDFQQVYREIAAAVSAAVEEKGEALYLTPGHPLVAEETVRLLLAERKERNWEIQLLSAMSFLDPLFTLLGLDPAALGFCLLDACRLPARLPEKVPLLFVQIYDRMVAGDLKLALLEQYEPETETAILWHAGEKGQERLIRCPLAELDHFKEFDYLTSVYFDGRGREHQERGESSRYPLDPLVEVFRKLLAPDGCPWDRAQTHESLKKYLMEEAGEVCEAIDEGSMSHLREELGDVLLQVVFHSALAEKRGDFDINGVVQTVTEKMIRRHPHVFGGQKAATPEEVSQIWQAVKAAEKMEN